MYARIERRENNLKKMHFPWLRILVHLLGWLPLADLSYAFLIEKLSVNPVQELEQVLGRIAIYWLVATLAITPLHTLTGWHDLRNRRRAAGLYAFMYTCLHLLVFFGLDYGFNLAWILDQITGNIYLQVGTLAVLLLIPLAITSFDYFRRKMGENWKRLHWLVYPAAVISILHYILAQKGNLFAFRGNILQPFLWGLLTILLLALRLPPVRGWLSQTREYFFTRARKQIRSTEDTKS
jgi:sulfoxide reductase heme-binding subunit YedZ